MAADVRETLPLIKDRVKDNPLVDEAGKRRPVRRPVDGRGMSRTSPDDIAMFLRFVRSFPGKYMGHTWKINETYATWMLNATPLGETDLRDTLLERALDRLIDRALTVHRSDLRPAFYRDVG